MYRSYATDLDGLDSMLEDKGVATLENVLSEDECVRIRDEMWRELEFVTRDNFQVNDRNTWKFFYRLFPLHSMLLQHWGLGQAQPVWDVRMHPKVGDAFSRLWGCPATDLLVSMDGISIHLPPEVTHRGWYLGNSWLHTDQSFLREGRQCVQALVNLYPVEEGDATFLCYEGSHRYHAEFGRAFEKTGKEDWYKLSSEAERQFFASKGCEEAAVKAPVGSMILWDSRTMHQGMEPLRCRTRPKFRMAFYVCMMPRAGVSQAVLTKRRNAFAASRITNHWATRPLLFPKMPRTYGQPVPELNEIHFPERTTQSPYGLRLIGW